jgi:hypothetical protein
MSAESGKKQHRIKCVTVTITHDLVQNMKKRITAFLEWIFGNRDSEKSHLEFQQEVRKQRREKAANAAKAKQ